MARPHRQHVESNMLPVDFEFRFVAFDMLLRQIASVDGSL